MRNIGDIKLNTLERLFSCTIPTHSQCSHIKIWKKVNIWAFFFKSTNHYRAATFYFLVFNKKYIPNIQSFVLFQLLSASVCVSDMLASAPCPSVRMHSSCVLPVTQKRSISSNWSSTAPGKHTPTHIHTQTHTHTCAKGNCPFLKVALLTDGQNMEWPAPSTVLMM